MRAKKEKKTFTIRKSNLGKGLKDIRGERTFKIFANIMGMRPERIHDFENGVKVPSLHVLSKYADLGGIEINLIFDSGVMLPE